MRKKHTAYRRLSSQWIERTRRAEQATLTDSRDAAPRGARREGDARYTAYLFTGRQLELLEPCMPHSLPHDADC